MKQSKKYETPKMEVIELGTFSVLCASGTQVDAAEFSGTGMNFTRGNGQW